MYHSNSWTFHIITLGCKVNQYESQAIREAWHTLGGREVPLTENPDVFLINSCAITAKGERDTRHALYNIERQRSLNNTQNNKKLCIITGCAAPLINNSFSYEERKKYFNLIVPPQAKAILLKDPRKLCNNTQDIASNANPFGKDGFAIKSFQRTRPILKVHDGCSHRCTYCIVPLMRGKSISRPAIDVLNEAKSLLEAGFNEIVISGINLNQYGRDLKNSNHSYNFDFWDLIALLEKNLAPHWQGKARMRISSLEPSQFTEKGLDVLTSSSLLCPHIHLSLQHGSHKVLKMMGRGHYKLDTLKENIAKLRQAWPIMGLGADILMGFPHEEEIDVKNTLDIIKDINLTYAHVFPYSARPNTAAINFDAQVPYALKVERAARVRNLIEMQQKKFLQEVIKKPSLELVVDDRYDFKQDLIQNNGVITYKGIDAHYTNCQIDLPKTYNTKQIIKASPIEVVANKIICKLT